MSVDKSSVDSVGSFQTVDSIVVPDFRLESAVRRGVSGTLYLPPLPVSHPQQEFRTKSSKTLIISGVFIWDVVTADIHQQHYAVRRLSFGNRAVVR